MKDVYHDFWQAQTTFEEISLPPFELSVEGQEAWQPQLIEEEPLDLRSRLRKVIDWLIGLGRDGKLQRRRLLVGDLASG